MFYTFLENCFDNGIFFFKKNVRVNADILVENELFFDIKIACIEYEINLLLFFIFFYSYFFISLYSAGIGRSGCFILIDAMLEQIDHQGTVDVYSYFKYLRSRRINMVQNVVGVNFSFVQESLYYPEKNARINYIIYGKKVVVPF